MFSCLPFFTSQAQVSACFQWNLSRFRVAELSFESSTRFCHQLKSEEITMITGFFNVINALLWAALFKYIPSQGGNMVALTLQAGQIEHKKGSACFRHGQEKVAYTVLTDVYWGGRGRGVLGEVGLGRRSTLLSCRWVLVLLWGICYTMFYVMRKRLEPVGHHLINRKCTGGTLTAMKAPNSAKSYLLQRIAQSKVWDASGCEFRGNMEPNVVASPSMGV